MEWVIEAQGLPNLIHELVHALFLGNLDDDHGFDYGQIPLDLERPEHRKHLWEELACCIVSTVMCAPHQEDPEAFTRAWFAEQFEIQGVFYGLEHDLGAFRARIDGLLRRRDRVEEFTWTVARALALVRESLASVGVEASLPPCDPLEIWRSYRGTWEGVGQ